MKTPGLNIKIQDEESTNDEPPPLTIAFDSEEDILQWRKSMYVHVNVFKLLIFCFLFIQIQNVLLANLFFQTYFL